MPAKKVIKPKVTATPVPINPNRPTSPLGNDRSPEMVVVMLKTTAATAHQVKIKLRAGGTVVLCLSAEQNQAACRKRSKSGQHQPKRIGIA